jgi:PTS system fructose-specific IIC component
MVVGLVKPDDGIILFDDKDITNLPMYIVSILAGTVVSALLLVTLKPSARPVQVAA